VAIVTGGASGIGAAVVGRLAGQGHAIVIADLSGDGAAELAGSLTDTGATAQGVACDVRDQSSIAAAVGAAQELGTLTTLINCAGLAGRSARIDRHSDEEWRAVLDVNLAGVILFTRAVAPILRDQQRGVIVNIASMAGLVGSRGQVVYSGAKAGVIGVTKATAKELMVDNVRVNAVAPGFIDTPMTETMTDEIKSAWGVDRLTLNGRFGTADEIAAAVQFLAGPDASYITGICLSVDGGFVLGYP
jgi:3-oxoacyl-[acyl-carrier protein] reductase